MMKKTYITPSVKAYKVKTNAIICASPSASIGTGTTDVMETREERSGNMWSGSAGSVQW